MATRKIKSTGKKSKAEHIAATAAAKTIGATFSLPEDLKERMKAKSRAEGYKGARHGADVLAYGVGCDDGKTQARVFLACLPEKNPDLGRGMQNIILDAAGDLKGSKGVLRDYRKGWLVGFCVNLNWALYGCSQAINHATQALQPKAAAAL